MYRIQKDCKGFPGKFMHYSYSAESYQTFGGGITFTDNVEFEKNMINAGTVDIVK